MLSLSFNPGEYNEQCSALLKQNNRLYQDPFKHSPQVPQSPDARLS